MSTRRTAASSTVAPANKEKRGSSTAPSNTARKTTTANHPSTKISSPAKNHGPSSSSLGKNVPNYLKATVGSNLGKQQGGENHVNASPTNRRGSLDHKPPTQQTRAPPRSSSFSGKTTVASHQKTGNGGADKGSIRANKDGAGKQLSMGSSSGNGRKSATTTKKVYVKKQPSTLSSNGSSLKKEEVVTISPVEKAPDHNEKVLSDDMEADREEVERGQGHESLTVEKAEDGDELESEHYNQTEAVAVAVEAESEDDGKNAEVVADSETSAAVEQQHDDHDDESVAVKNEENLQVEEGINDNHEKIINEVNNNDSIIGNDNDHVAAEDNDNHNNSPIENVVEVKDVMEGEEVAAKETTVQEVVNEKKREKINLTASFPGKKDNAVSNNVIEETASKLREQRKNKVKALAGAFETVISLQEPK